MTKVLAATLPIITALVVSGAAQAPADFSGRWTLEAPSIATTLAVPGTPAAAGSPGDMGSGWGTPLTISQDAKQLKIEYAFFSRYDAQPPLIFTYPLDGSETRNTVNMGRGDQVETSTAQWSGQTLIITTTYRIDDRHAGKPLTTQLTRKLSLESPATLIVEVTRPGVLGGPASTTRSIYRKG